jgi:hypothetical protein
VFGPSWRSNDKSSVLPASPEKESRSFSHILVGHRLARRVGASLSHTTEASLGLNIKSYENVMGSMFIKPVSSSLTDLIEEGKRLHALYLSDDSEEKSRIYSRWITIRAWILNDLKKRPNESIENWLNETHDSFYRIPEHPLEEPLL